MKQKYYAGFRLAKDFDFINLVNEIKSNTAIKVKHIAKLVEVIEMDYFNSSERVANGKKHIGFDFSYLTIEYKGNYYYIQDSQFSGFEVTGYLKISSTEKQQATHPQTFYNYIDLLEILDSQPLYTKALSKTYKQVLYSMDFNNMKEQAGARENHIINNLKDVYTTQHDASGHVLHLEALDGSSCEYCTMRQRFTN